MPGVPRVVREAFPEKQPESQELTGKSSQPCRDWESGPGFPHVQVAHHYASHRSTVSSGLLLSQLQAECPKHWSGWASQPEAASASTGPDSTSHPRLWFTSSLTRWAFHPSPARLGKLPTSHNGWLFEMLSQNGYTSPSATCFCERPIAFPCSVFWQ